MLNYQRVPWQASNMWHVMCPCDMSCDRSGAGLNQFSTAGTLLRDVIEKLWHATRPNRTPLTKSSAFFSGWLSGSTTNHLEFVQKRTSTGNPEKIDEKIDWFIWFAVVPLIQSLETSHGPGLPLCRARPRHERPRNERMAGEDGSRAWDHQLSAGIWWYMCSYNLVYWICLFCFLGVKNANTQMNGQIYIYIYMYIW